ncbi:SPOR domain-containing protein [Pseudomonas aeruginosa]
MRLTDASVAIRPRSAWEALDLGILLAHRHARLLMGSWALLTLPLFAVLSLLLWQHPTLAILIFWWLKPAFERLPLYILSHALFGDTPTLKQALRAYPALLRKQLPASLLWRRFSPTRSFDLPVLQLEGLAGEPRSQRLIVLSQRNAGGATWLTVVGVHLEMALWAGFAMLLYLLIPAQNEIDWNWQSLLDPEAGEWLWLEHLSNLLYVLVLVVWEPIYVACGFTLYLNRRTELEAWDIELVFRRLRQRLVGSAYVLLLGLAASLAWLPAPSAYAEPAASKPATTAAAKPAPAPAAKPASGGGAGSQWYRNQSGGNFALQILGTGSEANAQAFIRQQGGGDFRYFKKTLQGKPFYVVTYGSFPNRAAALAAVKKLPSKVQAGKPWPRTFASIQQEIGQAH